MKGFVLDRLTCAGNPENLAGIEKESRHTFVQGDICSAEIIPAKPGWGINAEINFATESHVYAAPSYSFRMMKTFS